MRPGTVFGALLILAGVIAFSVGGFSLSTRPILAGAAIVVGIVLIVASSRKAH